MMRGALRVKECARVNSVTRTPYRHGVRVTELWRLPVLGEGESAGRDDADDVGCDGWCDCVGVFVDSRAPSFRVTSSDCATASRSGCGIYWAAAARDCVDGLWHVHTHGGLWCGGEGHADARGGASLRGARLPAFRAVGRPLRKDLPARGVSSRCSRSGTAVMQQSAGLRSRS